MSIESIKSFGRFRSRQFQQFDSVADGGDEIGTTLMRVNGPYPDPYASYPALAYDHQGRWWKEQTYDAVHIRGRDGRYYTGGPFCKEEVKQSVSSSQVYLSSDPTKFIWHSYEGLILPVFNGAPGWTDILSDAEGEISQFGPKAWQKFCPGKPKVGLAQFVGELKDLPKMLKNIPHVLKGRARTFKDAGSQYLEANFGWIPFVSDLIDMYELSQHIPDELAKVKQANGKWLLRQGSVTTVDDTTDTWDKTGTGAWAFYPALHTSIVDSNSIRCSGREFYQRRVWFSGRFRYYIPDTEIKKPEWEKHMIRKMYGASLTPGLVWELTPWSWLIDYFTNAGDVISNLTSGYVDAVARYAYVMGTTTYGQEQSCSFKDVMGREVHGSIHRSRTYKVREGANPFGFGLNDDLSLKQLSILSALGISRS